MSLSEATIRRLAFLKYLYTKAVNESFQPEPMSASSILTFHDSVELFLQLSCENLNVRANNPSFMKYFSLLEPKLPEGELQEKESMKRMNKARGNLKHSGILPSKIDIEGFRASVTNFFQENTSIVFKLDFNSISLTHLIECDEAKKSLEDANSFKENNKIKEAFQKIAIAFDQVISHHEKLHDLNNIYSPYYLGESVMVEAALLKLSKAMAGDKKEPLLDVLTKLSISVHKMRNSLKIISLGIDYNKYNKFISLTHWVTKTSTEEYDIIRKNDYSVFSQKHFSFCFNFVIESALKLQDKL